MNTVIWVSAIASALGVLVWLAALIWAARPRTAFRRIYAPGTRQTRQGKPGLYRFHPAHTWSTTLLQDGHYHLEVEATDLRGNQGRLRQPFTITNEL